ncbi:hypothetical protein SRABI35_02076 [Stenotrophomonas lactitubi]|nr:hypothetical protein SRABI35_02076 [Stenotrophomonas lactitubi]
MPCHGSAFKRFARANALSIKNASAALTRASSSQRSGTATPALSRARSDHEHTLVAPRVLRSQSMKITPLRLALLIVAT